MLRFDQHEIDSTGHCTGAIDRRRARARNVARQRDVRAKRPARRSSNCVRRRPTAQALRRASASCRRRLAAVEAEHVRAPPGLDPIEDQHRMRRRVPTSRARRVDRVELAFCGNCAEKQRASRADCAAGSTRRAPSGVSRVARPAARASASVGHSAKNSRRLRRHRGSGFSAQARAARSSARATVWRRTASRSPLKRLERDPRFDLVACAPRPAEPHRADRLARLSRRPGRRCRSPRSRRARRASPARRSPFRAPRASLTAPCACERATAARRAATA